MVFECSGALAGLLLIVESMSITTTGIQVSSVVQMYRASVQS